jgi:hypothetical protein
MNICRRTLFPSFEGFAQSFRQLLVEGVGKEREDRMMRAAILSFFRASLSTEAPEPDLAAPRDE